MKVFFSSLVLIFNLVLCSAQNFNLKNGDILFRESTSNTLSKAIDNVTQTNKNTHFSHMGLVFIENDSIYVLHAAPKVGSIKVSLNEFLIPSDLGDSLTTKTIAYRLKSKFTNSIPVALQKAHNLLGKPYNYSYIMNDSSYYCSDFVYRAFKKDSIFKLAPMTFKDSKNNSFLNSWVLYYKRLNLKIPEGALGCNPNGMVASNKLIVLGEVIAN